MRKPEIIDVTGPGFDKMGNVIYTFEDCAEFTGLKDAVDLLHNDLMETHVVGENPPRYPNQTASFVLNTSENRQLFIRLQELVGLVRGLLSDMSLPVEKLIREDEGASIKSEASPSLSLE